MPLLLLLVGYFFPRLVVAVLYLFTDWWSNSFDGWLIPLLGFFFMPLTVLWYGISVAFFDGGAIHLIGMAVAIALDLGLIGRGAKKK